MGYYHTGILRDMAGKVHNVTTEYLEVSLKEDNVSILKILDNPLENNYNSDTKSDTPWGDILGYFKFCIR